MAKMFLCYNLCLFYVILTRIFVASSTDYNDIKTESIHRVEGHSPEIYSYDSSHNVQKRDIIPELLVKNVHKEVVASTETPTTMKDFTIPTKKKMKKFEKASSVSPAVTTDSRLQENLTKNLGENGAGQKKNLTKTIKHPELVHRINLDNPNINRPMTDDELPSDFDTVLGEKKFNETLKENNITNSKTDENKFYKSSVYNSSKVGQYYWIDMSSRSDVKTNELLSGSHRRAATVKLSFEFPFYGHLITNVTIATGGFLYTGDYVHSWLAATQYIAPLMANFDTSLSNDSFIKYVDNGTTFTVEWEKVRLQDKPQGGAFTFQVTLFKRGDIVFVYKEIPLLVDEIQELHHPVKVGLSDAYIMDKTVFLVRRKTIYEYDRVHLNKTDLKDWSTIYLKALPTCLDAQDCVSCLTRDLVFKCQWCPIMNKCSEGFDRHRQDWLAQGCDKHSIKNISTCSAARVNPAFSTDTTYEADTNIHEDSDNEVSVQKPLSISINDNKKVSVSGIMAVIFLVAVICGLISWVFYAYRNPHTPSGQILIRYRPSQWRWRRGEARYTAATIHM